MHSQFLATPFVPPRVQTELDRCAAYSSKNGRCLLCDVIDRERSGGDRIVEETEGFAAFEPYAARFSYETHVTPKNHLSHFEETDDRLLSDLAKCLRATLLRIERAAGRPAYNYLILTAPPNEEPMKDYHWRLEILPRITGVAGFEWGTGIHINVVLPEEAARQLRAAEVGQS